MQAGTESSAGIPSGTVCVQWVWTDSQWFGGIPSGGTNVYNGANGFQNTNPATNEEQDDGLHPTRIAIVLLGSDVTNGDNSNSTTSGVVGERTPMYVIRATGAKASELRRSAAQLKVR